MAICFLLISVQVQAATKNKISIKVNGAESATLEKQKNIWSITTGDEEKDKLILSSKVLYLKIPKGKELVTGYYVFNSKGAFTLLIPLLHGTGRRIWLLQKMQD